MLVTPLFLHYFYIVQIVILIVHQAKGSLFNELEEPSKFERLSPLYRNNATNDDPQVSSRDADGDSYDVKVDDQIFVQRKTNGTESLASAADITFWPETRPGVYQIPIVLSPNLPRNFSMMILHDILQLKRGSNIEFVKKEPFHHSYIEFVYGENCQSPVGKVGGPQTISLGNGCMSIGTAAHEILHALGFHHEHQRSDADDYVVYNSPDPRSQNVNTRLERTINYTPYDVWSIMHYTFQDNNRSWKENYIIKGDYKIAPYKRGRAIALTSCDWYALNRIYKGRKRGPPCIPSRRLPVHLVPTNGALGLPFDKSFLHEWCSSHYSLLPTMFGCSFVDNTENYELSWLKEADHLHSPFVSFNARRAFCARYKSTCSDYSDSSCFRYCVHECPYLYRTKSLRHCMSTVDYCELQ